jgi:peptidoglycan/LPS O-acetylase OafA/YrhL
VWGVPAALTVAGALSLELSGKTLRAPRALVAPTLLLGDASYCIYLFHLPATAVIAHTMGYGDARVFLPVSIAVSIAAGLAAHFWIEKPLLAVLRRPSALRAT